MPKSYVDRISVRHVTRDLEIPYHIADSLVKKSCDLGILIERYAITCPECGLVLKIAEADNLLDSIEEIKYCYGCDEGVENLDLKIDRDNIYLIYKLNMVRG